MVHEGGYEVPGSSFEEGLGFVLLELGILIKPRDPVIPGYPWCPRGGVIHMGYNEYPGGISTRCEDPGDSCRRRQQPRDLGGIRLGKHDAQNWRVSLFFSFENVLKAFEIRLQLSLC